MSEFEQPQKPSDPPAVDQPALQLPNVPDPNGEPVAQPDEAWSGGAFVASAVIAFLGLGFALLPMTPCLGATRSSRLKNMARQAEIDAALQKQQESESVIDSTQTES